MALDQPSGAFDADLPMSRLPVVEPAGGFSLLRGICVVDLSTSIAGPYAAMLLSDFGAEVIKVERPGGDDSRSWGPPFLSSESLWFLAVNRNKKSVVLDLATAAGRSDLLALIGKADVVVTNQPPDVQRSLGLDYKTLAAHRPNLIFTSITGFGLSGERSGLTCYDLIAEGYSGVMDLTGEADGPPQKVGAPAADMLAGQDAAMATIAALFDRERTGSGRLIDVSLVESMTRFLSCRLSSYLGSGEPVTRSGGTDSVIAVYQQFETADEPVTLGLGTDGIWQRFWAAVGDPDFGQRQGFETNAARRQQRETVVHRIQSILRNRRRNEWLDVFAAARVPAGPINGLADVVSDEALQERGMFSTLADGDRVVPQVGLGIHIDGKPHRARSAPPRLGEHTEEVISALRNPSTMDSNQ